jgi:hypothetical protein
VVSILTRTVAICLALLTLLVVAPPTRVAAAKHDFSGEYTLVASRGAFKFRGAAWLLHIAETESSIEITKTVEGRKYVNKFRLDGSEATYTTSSGQQGTGKAQFRGRSLVVDGSVAHLESTSAGMQIHIREKWELSSDGKTLTVNVHIDFPKSVLEGYDAIDPWTEIYARN